MGEDPGGSRSACNATRRAATWAGITWPERSVISLIYSYASRAHGAFISVKGIHESSKAP